jgi:hypothetical protein
VATVAGSIKMVDTKKGKVLARLDLTSYTIFETDWNHTGVVACSENGNIYFITFDANESTIKLENVFTCESALRTIQWNPQLPQKLAAGTFEGKIIIIKVDKGNFSVT